MRSFFFLTFTFITTYTNAQQQAFKLNFNIESEFEKFGDGELLDSKGVPEPSTTKQSVLLLTSESFTISSVNKESRYYDFDNEIILTTNKDTLKSAVPIYSVIDYRVSEYTNRTYLSDILQAGGVGDALGDLANLESIFGLEIDKNRIRDSIKLLSSKNVDQYSFKGNVLAKVKYSTSPIPKKYQKAFARYMSYNWQIHPYIRQEIVQKNQIPEWVEFSYSNVGTKTTKLYTLINSEPTSYIPFDLSNKKLVYNKSRDNMNELVNAMSISTLIDPPKKYNSSDYFNEAKKLAKAEQNLSGLLRLFQYLLSTGEQPVDEIRAIASKQKSDNAVSTFIQCLNRPKSKEEAEEKIALLEGLIKLDVKYGFVMNIFAANYIEPIDQSKAIDYFYQVLSKDPYITGVYLDLGKIYASRYQHDDAWKCFGVMLVLKPDHSMAQELMRKKSDLKENYPEYFK
ncbi:MAG: hypothetical protein CL840_17585 [Crocinitomicaceae bacterium]|nr:hypothetical protein [Crocinitomicaceae bacterium]|tara:strand:- start:3224 stop:4588 length:1365 start_codon:yes stop_codon:yes gene_type:complete